MSIGRTKLCSPSSATTYGGDGVQTFALPNLSGKSAISSGQARAFPTTRWSGRRCEYVTLTIQQMPAHTIRPLPPLLNRRVTQLNPVAVGDNTSTARPKYFPISRTGSEI